jgi:hypothetical protein
MMVPVEAEHRALLARVVPDYQRRGYSVEVEPAPRTLPDFLLGFRPDALALREGENVVIEVEVGRRSGSESKLAALRRQIGAQAGWRLDVIYAPGDMTSADVLPANVGQLVATVADVRRLVDLKQHKAAFLLAWSALEGATRFRSGEERATMSSAGAVEWLAMHGYLDAPQAGRVRCLLALRNRLAHGDLAADPTSNDFEILLSVIDGMLTGSA